MNNLNHFFHKFITSSKKIFARKNLHPDHKISHGAEIIGDTLPQAAKAFGSLENQALAILTLKKSINDLGIPKEDAIALAKTAHQLLINQESIYLKTITLAHQKAFFFVLHALLNDYNEHAKNQTLIHIKAIADHPNTHPDIKVKALEALT